MGVALWTRIEDEAVFPISALVSLTNKCPLSCPHCFNTARGDEADLALPELTALFDQLASLGTLRLALTGGEPTLRPELEEIVAAAWERRFLITLKTSGLLLTPDRIVWLRELGLASLHVSLHHARAEEHDRFVGKPGAWRHAVEALSAFRATGGVSVACTVVMDWNAGAIPDLVDLCGRQGWSFIVDSRIVHRNNGEDVAARLGPTRPDLVDALRCLPGSRQVGPAPEPTQRICNAGKTSLYVLPDGEVWLCPILPVSIGNVRDRTFAELWDSSELRRRVVSLKWSDSAECMACGYNRFCERCPGEAYLEHGDLRRPAAMDCAAAQTYYALWAAGGACK